ncbi:MAG: arginine--tRNA ligase [Candidatus Omnitrophica bacterium]|nr:arginine--tRNA ligase [Candidatus Omnitrophota bacterium]
MRPSNLEIGLEQILCRVLADSGYTEDSTPIPIQLEIPKVPSHGDLTTNVAMRLAKVAHKAPTQLAGEIAAALQQQLGNAGLAGAVREIKVQPPGFINFWLSDTALYQTLFSILDFPEEYGKVPVKAPVTLVEYVSANPTGPMTVAHGRQAAFGDALARILEFLEIPVTREYYVNDEGRQIGLLGESVLARALELQGRTLSLPEDGYQGEYIVDVAKDLLKDHPEWVKAGKPELARISRFAVEHILKGIREDLEVFRVGFDQWTWQSGFRESGELQGSLDTLKEAGHIFEEEGALWFRSTAFGDDKDRVVVRANGDSTYLASDIAYHRQKLQRGFERMVDVWGPDHHGYIARIKACIEAFGQDPKALNVILVQLCSLFRKGQPVRMSTRAGEFVTLRELVDEVGVDAARFFYLMRKADAHLNFDLELAKERSLENPVYYIQYAHARICGILERNAGAASVAPGEIEYSLLQEEVEVAILRRMREFPHSLRVAAGDLEPFQIIPYLQDLAGLFHRFYDRHRVVTEDPALTAARCALIRGVRSVLARGLDLLGVGAPETM